MFVMFFDGHAASNFVPHEMEFRFYPETVASNDGDPVADVWYTGDGTRHGELNNYGATRVICTFRDHVI